MSSATSVKIASPKPSEPGVVDDAVADIKHAFAYATTARTELAENVLNAANAIGSFNQASLKAFIQTGEILTTGSQDLFRQVLASSQTVFHETLSDFRALVAAKTVTEALESQIGLARASANRSIAESRRVAQVGLDLAEKTSALLAAQAELAAKTFSVSKIQ
jgi:hypothetical protein